MENLVNKMSDLTLNMDINRSPIINQEVARRVKALLDILEDGRSQDWTQDDLVTKLLTGIIRLGVPRFRYWNGEAAEGRIRRKAETFTKLMARKVLRGVSENITWDQATDRGLALCVGFGAYITAIKLAKRAARRGSNHGSSSERP